LKKFRDVTNSAHWTPKFPKLEGFVESPAYLHTSKIATTRIDVTLLLTIDVHETISPKQIINKTL